MATRVNAIAPKESIAQALPIFETVSKNGDLLKTEGTFIIIETQSNSDQVATLNKHSLEKALVNSVVVFKGAYKNGQAYYYGEILQNYSVYIYPNGYFGVDAGLRTDSTAKVFLPPPNLQADQVRQNQIEYINNKINKGVIDQPK
jgi:hypothetical protein